MIFLTVDPSSSHLAYCLAEITDKDLHIHHTGMIWTKTSWTKGMKLLYMQYAFKYLVHQMSPMPDKIITEAYFMNPKLKIGIAVIPTVNHLLEMQCTHPAVTMEEISPSRWRKLINIKPDYVNGKRDYKAPVRRLVESHMELPKELISNVTGRARATPHDLTDAIGIALSQAPDKKVTVGNACFHNFSLVNYLSKFKLS